MAVKLNFQPKSYGVMFSLTGTKFFGREKVIPLAQWPAVATGSLFAAVNLLIRLHEEYPEPECDSGILLNHETIANLSQSQATMLHLSPITPMSLSLQSWGNISQPDFRIQTSWLTPQGTSVIGVRRQGAMLHYEGSWQRLPATLYSLCEAIDAHNAVPDTEEDKRREYLARITDALPEEIQNKIQKDGYLSSLRVYHAAALSLQLNTKEGEFDFLPILFGQRHIAIHQEDDELENSTTEMLTTEVEALLPPAHHKRFLQHYTHTYPTTRASYVLGDNRYMFLDPMLQQALEVVRQMRAADADTRRNFVRTPQRYFKEYLGDVFDESALEAMFVPTQEYSERVVGLGLWVKKALPWIVSSNNQWFPETYGIQVGDTVTIIPDSETAEKNSVAIKEAIREGKETVLLTGELPDASSELHDISLSGNPQLAEQVVAPATQDTLDTLASIHRLLEAKEQAQDVAPPPPPVNTENAVIDVVGPIFLDAAENVEARVYCQYRPHKPVPFTLTRPVELKTELKPHQNEALEWLAKMWSAGYSGALLADDMGLGKTLACLAFLAWVRQRRLQIGRKPAPILVVAPTSLIGNWQTEAETHLHDHGLGACFVAQGANLKQLRLSCTPSGRDIDDGTSRLDATRLAQFDWILTTYETLRDYHHSFAAIPLGVVVFDEMQKAKNCTSQISCAIRVLNAEFALGLTGTPIENSLADLWVLMDILLPGFLGELRQFNSKYSNPTEADLVELKTRMEGYPGQDFRPMLRRMKSNTLIGLPCKHEHVYQTSMPDVQALAYEKAMCEYSDHLALLQALRMVSLHPLRPSEASSEEYQSLSARFITTLALLDDISKKGEKALVFLESREHQPIFAALLQERYGLPRLPMIINGQTPGITRHKYVQKFQSERDCFDVMLLSPKAAGVGLTLTAANHVIHLSRWWNPAIEDQCTDRIYRLGQDRDVHVYCPLAVHTQPHLKDFSFDLQLQRLLEKKRTLSRDVLLPSQTGKEAKELYAMIKNESPCV